MDPDVTRWGLHQLLDGTSEHGVNNVDNSQPNSTVHVGEIPGQVIVEMDPERKEQNSVENDELIARALHEEFTYVASGRSSGMDHAAQYDTVISQDWKHSSRNIVSAEDPQPSNSSPRLIEIMDDSSALDGNIIKRLSHMVSVPHVPKVNGEIPSVDEATSSHQRLLERLMVYRLVERKVEGDGNCQFRALSDQLYRSSEYHRAVRLEVVNQLTTHREMYEGYVPMDYDVYLKKMSQNGEWGDHVTLQAAADSYGFKIFILTSYKNTCYVEILPATLKSSRVILLSFWAEVHYNSIYPEEEFPVIVQPKKKRHTESCSVM